MDRRSFLKILAAVPASIAIGNVEALTGNTAPAVAAAREITQIVTVELDIGRFGPGYLGKVLSVETRLDD